MLKVTFSRGGDPDSPEANLSARCVALAELKGAFKATIVQEPDPLSPSEPWLRVDSRGAPYASDFVEREEFILRDSEEIRRFCHGAKLSRFSIDRANRDFGRTIEREDREHCRKSGFTRFIEKLDELFGISFTITTTTKR